MSVWKNYIHVMPMQLATTLLAVLRVLVWMDIMEMEIFAQVKVLKVMLNSINQSINKLFTLSKINCIIKIKFIFAKLTQIKLR